MGDVNGVSFLDRINRRSGQTVQLCYHCHKCTAGCPTANGMAYGPERVLRLIQLGQWQRVLTSRDAWLCLGCDMCGVHCPNEIDAGRVMIALKQMAEQAGFRQEDCGRLRELLADYLAQRPEVEIDDRLCEGVQRLNNLSQTILSAHNISGDDNLTRLIWSQNLERIPPGLGERRGVEIVYFVGCVASFFPRSYRVPQATVSILDAVAGARAVAFTGSGAGFTTLAGQEWCCGYPLLSMGRLEQARPLIQHNVARVKELGAARCVTACPSCYHMWKFVYPEVLGENLDVEVLHITELLGELIAQGKIAFENEIDLRVTYHDPCDLGRKSHVYEPPRRVLESIPGITLVEMSSCGQISECCGGGGNLESFDPEAVSEVAWRRIDRAFEVGAQVVVSACQQCERTLTAAVRHHEGARRTAMRVMDVTELVWQAMEQ